MYGVLMDGRLLLLCECCFTFLPACALIGFSPICFPSASKRKSISILQGFGLRAIWSQAFRSFLSFLRGKKDKAAAHRTRGSERAMQRSHVLGCYHRVILLHPLRGLGCSPGRLPRRPCRWSNGICLLCRQFLVVLVVVPLRLLPHYNILCSFPQSHVHRSGPTGGNAGRM